MDKIKKREMMNYAFKWRENIKKKEHEHLCEQALLLFMLIIIFSNTYYIYNNFDKKLIN
jgi:hypothetical protein